MSNFKPLTLEDKSIIEKYLSKNTSLSYEYSFVDLYIWRNICNIKYIILNNILIIQKNEEGKGTFFMQPIGYEKQHLKELVIELKNLNSKQEQSSTFFGDVENTFVYDLKETFSDSITIIPDIDDFEYLYNTKDLIELKGKKYHTKRNHCNAFEKKYDYKLREINTEEIITDCIKLLDTWQNTKIINTTILLMEKDLIIDMLSNIITLNLKAIALYVNDEIAGFTVGEILSKDMGVIHIEKADTKFIGVYSFLNREFLKMYFSNISIVNRQEDCGEEGLRKAKEGYRPIEKLEKYLVTLS